MAKNERLTLAKALYECIGILSEPFRTKNDPELIIKKLVQIRAFYCQKHTQSSAVRKYALLKNTIRELAQQKLLVVYDELPKEPKKTADYLNYKKMAIPRETLDKLSITKSADTIFNETLDKCCPPEIAKRLREHVRSFKAQKNHRIPLVKFLIQLFKTAPDWPKHPKIIQGELLKFRNNLLNSYQRNTAYGKFQNVKNAFVLLVDHQLLSNDLELPSNLRRCTNTQKIRFDSPIISEININYSQNVSLNEYSANFIIDLKHDISNNIKLLVSAAQAIVYKAYLQYLSKDSIVANSQIKEFINHPRLLVKNAKSGARNRKELNPFYKTHPKCFENRLAALDFYFDCVCNNNHLPDVEGLRVNNQLLGYLGLTPFVASAMQIIIVNELGINPYSLYKVKTISDGHGHEFIQPRFYVSTSKSIIKALINMRSFEIQLSPIG